MKEVFQNRTWDIQLWKPGNSLDFVNNETHVGIDTEYEPREAGDGPIKTVVGGFAWLRSGISHIVWYTDIPEYLQEVRRQNQNLWYYLFNAPGDMDALDFRNNFLWDEFWGDSRNGEYRVIDVMLRMALYEIAGGVFYDAMGLNHYCEKYLNESIEGKAKKSKNSAVGDSIQTSYRRDMELTEDHIKYGGMDPIATVVLGNSFEEQPTEKYKTRGGYSLYCMSERGYPVDKDEVQKRRWEQVKEGWKHLEFLCDWGIWPGPSSKIIQTREFAELVSDNPDEFDSSEFGVPGSDKEKNRVLLKLEQDYGIRFVRSGKTGSISLDQDKPYYPFVQAGYNPHPLIDHDKGFRHAGKMVSNFLTWDNIRDDTHTVHPRYKPIVINGRTSASQPNLQQIPQGEGIRTIYTAPPGCLLLIIDVEQGELCTLAQSNYTRFGFSYMRDLINQGYDLHSYFSKQKLIPMIGADYDNMGKEEFKKEYRQRAKPCNFGFPGGLGTASFVTYARNSWGIEFSPDFAKQAKEAWLNIFPENEYHLQPKQDVPFWLRNFKIKLKDHLDSRTVNSISSLDEGEELLRRLNWTEDEISNIFFRSSSYQVETYHGAVKRNSGYSAACNYSFSRPMADAMSYAMEEFEKKGIHPNCFVHDEFHFPLRNDEHLQKNIKYIQDIMLEAIQHMVPDVTMGIESQLTRRWYKEAEPVYGENGELYEWSPEMSKN